MTAAAPSGVVTFLFTDVEGSTRRWEADADAMRKVLAAHDEVLRSAIDAHGPEVVWDFANDAGMTDALVEREQQRQDEAVARELDPNSLINMLRRRRERS
jgi:class 3 adenylate cyclase